MAKYYIRKHDTEKVVSNLTVSDLKELAQTGRLTPNDEIRKSGHKTWHRASSVKGLAFCEPSTTAATPESHTESVQHDEQIYNVESETVAEISEQISTDANEFEICWSDGRKDGPFSIKELESLLNDGVINCACKFKDRTGGMFLLDDLDLVGYDQFNVSWSDGRQDGPFTIKVIQKLVDDGIVDFDCEFISEDQSVTKGFNGLGLVINKTVSETPKNEKTSQHAPKVKTEKVKTEKVKTEKVKTEKVKWRKGWLRRFIVKTTASIAIIALVIGLGCWGIWQAMSEKQRDTARDYSSSLWPLDNGESVVNPQSEHQSQNQAGESGSSNQGSSSPSVNQVGDDFIGQMIPTSVNNTFYSLPEAGPIWLHEELNMPVIGGLANTFEIRDLIGGYYDFDQALFPQLFKLTPKNTLFRKWAPWNPPGGWYTRRGEGPEILYGLTGRALYQTEKFGKTIWLGIDENTDSNPNPRRTDIALMEIASELGLFGQGANPSAMLSNWYEDIQQTNNVYDAVWNPTKYNQWCIPTADLRLSCSVGKSVAESMPSLRTQPAELDEDKYVIEEQKTDGIAMLSSDTYPFGYLYFERDENGRVVEVGTWNEQGENQKSFLRYEYKFDGSISSFSTVDRGFYTWIRWIPKYSKGKLVSISSEPRSVVKGERSWGFEQALEQHMECSYKYDSTGRAIEINLIFLKTEKSFRKKSSDIVPVMDSSRVVEVSLTLLLEYEDQNEYWSTAILSSTTSQSQTDQAPVKKENGVVRFEQHLVDNGQ